MCCDKWLAGVMTHLEKVKHFVAEAKEARIRKSDAAPPLWRLLWRAGIELPPPLFMRFWSLFLLLGGYWGTLMFLFWLITVRVWFKIIPIADLVSASLVGGIFFGLTAAVYYRHVAKRLHLSAWTDYGGLS
jgi:Family of unknown function (DUF6404)